MILGEINFAEVLAHFRRDVIEFELRVNLFFSLAGDWLLTLERGQAVFVQRVSHFQRSLAERYIVALGSREVLHRRAKRFRWQQPYINLHAAANVKADLIVATGDDIHKRRILRDVRYRLMA